MKLQDLDTHFCPYVPTICKCDHVSSFYFFFSFVWTHFCKQASATLTCKSVKGLLFVVLAATVATCLKAVGSFALWFFSVFNCSYSHLSCNRGLPELYPAVDQSQRDKVLLAVLAVVEKNASHVRRSELHGDADSMIGAHGLERQVGLASEGRDEILDHCGGIKAHSFIAARRWKHTWQKTFYFSAALHLLSPSVPLSPMAATRLSSNDLIDPEEVKSD